MPSHYPTRAVSYNHRAEMMRAMRLPGLCVILITLCAPAAAQEAADALLARANDLIRRGEYRQALALLEPLDERGLSTRQAATRQAATRHAELATALGENGQYDRSLAAADTGRRLAQQIGANDLLAIIEMARGTTLRHQGYPLEATFTDAGSADTHTATIDWGDGSRLELVTIAGTESGGVTGDHRYRPKVRHVKSSHTHTKAKSYTVTVCVTDDDGGRSCDSLVRSIKHPK